MGSARLRWIRLFVLAIMCSAMLAYTFPAQANSKYAALMIDANTGYVIHAENASRTRYPASLTKLMTLYLTFDALRSKKLSLRTRLKASKKAASMPSTNLSMKPGDRITVEQAIKALVVRSANDVAVILAERLAGSEYRFAKRMTAVARRLGMENTTFRNASGLPDSKQKTTARDMAKLALALQRHFPEYFHYFAATQFTYKGRKYKSHNRAMARIPGADGMKTGYIRASGFNLITSAKRRGKSLIGVVMGGKTSKSRDNEMVRLVEKSFAKMIRVKGRRQFVLGGTPVPKSKPVVKQASVALAKNISRTPEKVITQAQAAVIELASPAQPEKAEVVVKSLPKLASAAQSVQGQFTPVSYQLPTSEVPSQAVSVKTSNANPSAPWGIQVGAYRNKEEAEEAVSAAMRKAPDLLRSARINVQDTLKINGKILHRARLADMQRSQARLACKRLLAQDAPCFVYRDEKAI